MSSTAGMGFPQKLKMSCDFIVAVWGASVHILETADLGSLPVFLLQQTSLVVLECLGQLNRGHLIWPMENNLYFIQQGSPTAWGVRC